VLTEETYYAAKPRLVAGRRPVPDGLMAAAANIVLPAEATVKRQVLGSEKEGEE